MKKIIFFTVLIAVVATAGFWTTRKVCSLCFLPKQNHTYPKLDLSGPQQKSVIQAENKFRAYADKVCMKICDLRLEIVQMMAQSNVDKEALNKKIEEVGQLQISLEKSVAEHVLEMKKHLTPEQSERYLDSIRRELHSTMRHMGMNSVEMAVSGEMHKGH
jgi:Spy/CpxP family protein refolding chaperone